MKAAILVERNKDLVLADIPIPELDVGQVLVKVSCSGICGKQIDEIEGKRYDPFLPHLLGHEGSGVVEEVGVGVRKVQVGDYVVLHWMKGSGIDSEPPRFQWGNEKVSAGWVTTFSEYTIASENRVTKIPDDFPLDLACLLGCAVTTGLGIVFNNANLKPQQSILVFGCGGVGLNVIQGARLVNAYPIGAVDIFLGKLGLAEKLGATDTMVTTEDQKYDVTVDTTGLKHIRELAYRSAKSKVILAGVPYERDLISIDSYPIHAGKQIIGSHGGDTKPDIDIPRDIELYKRGLLKLEEQITHRFPLQDINEAVRQMKRGNTGKCVIWM